LDGRAVNTLAYYDKEFYDGCPWPLLFRPFSMSDVSQEQKWTVQSLSVEMHQAD
jgi:hypothetical protein